MRSFQKRRRGSLWNTLEGNANAVVIHSAGKRESLMVSKHRSEVIKDVVLEDPARKL